MSWALLLLIVALIVLAVLAVRRQAHARRREQPHALTEREVAILLRPRHNPGVSFHPLRVPRVDDAEE